MYRFVLTGTCLLGLASPVLANAAVLAPENDASDAATTTAAAHQPISSAGTGATDENPEIVVTARRRLESAQNVPVAISVVGGDHLDNTGSFNVERLQQLTPTV